MRLLLKIVLLGTTLFCNVAFAECKIYVDPEFNGAEGVVQNNDLVRFEPEPADGKNRSLITNHKVREFRDTQWLNKISSVKVSDNCKAIFWNEKGQHVGSATAAQLPPSHDNANIAVYCECK